MIFHTYNPFRISDSSKDFSESYEESAWFSKILEIDSESLKAAFISKIQKNCKVTCSIKCLLLYWHKIHYSSRFIINNQSGIHLYKKKTNKNSRSVCLQIFKFFVQFVRFSIYSEFYIFFPILVVAYWTSSFWIASDEISFWVLWLSLF